MSVQTIEGFDYNILDGSELVPIELDKVILRSILCLTCGARLWLRDVPLHSAWHATLVPVLGVTTEEKKDL